MSEYQYLHFVACDRPLDDAALEYMENQSTRADISRWEFTNEYHYSGFRGNTKEMLRRGYDVHLHFANFGIRKLMFRLPDLPCNKKTFAAFEVEYGVAWTKDKRGKAGVLSIEPEALGADRGPAKASQIAQRLRTRKPRSNVLIGILRKRGWIE